MTRATTVALLAAICLLMPAPAYAYVDPGAGGMLVQLLTGGVAGLLVFGRLMWGRIKGRFRRDKEQVSLPTHVK